MLVASIKEEETFSEEFDPKEKLNTVERITNFESKFHLYRPENLPFVK